MRTTWRRLIGFEMSSNGDGWDALEGVAPDLAALDVEFDNDFGTHEGPAFTVWTKHRVYFPLEYDGSESVGSVPRHPTTIPTEHQ